MEKSKTGVAILKSGQLVNYAFFKEVYVESLRKIGEDYSRGQDSFYTKRELGSVSKEFFNSLEKFSPKTNFTHIFEDVQKYVIKNKTTFELWDEDMCEKLLVRLVNVKVSMYLVLENSMSEELEVVDNQDVASVIQRVMGLIVERRTL